MRNLKGILPWFSIALPHSKRLVKTGCRDIILVPSIDWTLKSLDPTFPTMQRFPFLDFPLRILLDIISDWLKCTNHWTIPSAWFVARVDQTWACFYRGFKFDFGSCGFPYIYIFIAPQHLSDMWQVVFSPVLGNFSSIYHIFCPAGSSLGQCYIKRNSSTFCKVHLFTFSCLCTKYEVQLAAS